ncbi:MAG: phosphoglycerate kinase [Chlamydiales bacterium]|nr:phosphoglycerate kinase [Chlamydiales bacterium]
MAVYKGLRSLEVEGKSVLLRVDFNVPLNDQKEITDDTRLRKALPSIQYLISRGAKVVLMSHLGRPGGKKDPAFSLRPCIEYLRKALQQPVTFIADCVGPKVAAAVGNMKNGEVLLLENLRFYAEETDEQSAPLFAAELAQLGDCLVNDAFGTAHRKHASNYYLAKKMAPEVACGFLLKEELLAFNKLENEIEKPFYAVLAGAKISGKIHILDALIDRLDGLILGGAMAHTFLAAKEEAIGSSFYEELEIETAKRILQTAKDKGIDLVLPIDLVYASQKNDSASLSKTINVGETVPKDLSSFDIGPGSVSLFLEKLQKAQTVFWNGPLGVYESEVFRKGTLAFAEGLAAQNSYRVIGGGDSVASINLLGLGEKFDHVSTGGGAALKLLEQHVFDTLEPYQKNSLQLME